MALTDGNGGLSPADIAAVMGNNGYGNNGFGGYGGDGAWWLLVLFLFAFNGGNRGGLFGNGGGSNDCYGVVDAVNANTQRGFDQLTLSNGINTLNGNLSNGFNNLGAAVNNGFSDQAVSQCNQTTTLLQGQNGINTALLTGFAGAANQASNDKFDTISTLNNGHNAILQQMGNYEMARQNCCCETKADIADLKSTVISENCADRTALDNQTATLLQAMNTGFQGIKDMQCQQEIEALKTQNQQLQMQAYINGLNASQADQTSRLISNNQAQTDRLLDYIAPQIRPSYNVPNPYAYSGFPSNCGCGCAG